LCLIALAWRARPGLRLLVAANRDEWRDRPAEPARWWADHPSILAGRDLQAGGTWLGATRGGRFAAVTNFRDPADRRSTALSRGGLISEFLLSPASARDWVSGLASRADQYNGFNLLVSDGPTLWYYGSRAGDAMEVSPGVHALSNHVLDEPWPKVTRAREAMAGALERDDPAPALFALLSDTEGVPDAELPDTGVGIAWERRLAPPLITGAEYGTRASTVVAIADDGAIAFEERSRGPDGGVTGTVVERFA
jgi:uncharacterized protein with NRDE domain